MIKLLIILVFIASLTKAQDGYFTEVINTSLVGGSGLQGPLNSIEKILMTNDSLRKELKKKNIPLYDIQTVIDQRRTWSSINNNSFIIPKLNVCFYLEGEMLDKSNVINGVKNIANEWSSVCGVVFVFDLDNSCKSNTKDAGDIRITFNDRLGVPWSLIGKEAESKVGPTVSLTGILLKSPTSDEFRRVVLHEFGHVLGMMHEHQHPSFDCDINYEKVTKELGWSDEFAHRNFEKVIASGGILISEYDQTSIMHYPVKPIFLKQPCSHIFPLNTTISPKDKEAIRNLYPRNSTEYAAVQAKLKKKSEDILLAFGEPFLKRNSSYVELEMLLKQQISSSKKNLSTLKNKNINIDKFPIDN